MKRVLFVILTLFYLIKVEAQVSQTEHDLMKKYWDYKDRFNKHFIKIGALPGESMPIGEWYKDQNCGDFTGGQIKMGDAMGYMGDYMSVLATEYFLTKKQVVI